MLGTFIKRYLPVLLSISVPATSAAQPQLSDPPSPPSAEDAPIAYLIDAANGQVLFAREADRRFMPASITKTMTIFLAFEMMEEGKLTQDKRVAVSPAMFKAWRGVGSTMFLDAQDQVRIDDLIHGIATVSANDGAAVLAEGAAGSVRQWVDAMNAKAQDIGMSDSRFGTPNGWMDEGRTFVTARDLGTLAHTMIERHPAKYAHYVGKREFRFNEITQPNHDPLSGVVPGADGIKTGFTNQAGYGYLGSARRGDRRLILVVAGSPRGTARNRAARDLLEWGFTNFDEKVLATAGVEIGTAEVQGGKDRYVGLAPREGVHINLPHDRTPTMTTRIVYEGPLRAPIAKGETVAHLEVSAGPLGTFEIPLAATANVDEATPIWRTFNAILGWFS
ncbi:D-alanyl-D-alanine carboxypeptidase [Erythrobacter litoralis]|uniref:D-alanyl-D-alanine carboxypeptidase family protein n=1 Tax=Erythrobacter litoralis TaxID=39960 RepID=UPI00243558B3|nr:D-alanyl-D-alanine carboxypeptidase [Erythrobacter litoralis]MDG6078182.1 D-alanyl-D-alanine carboxypeptidase [Erythrobacter litoralis]